MRSASRAPHERRYRPDRRFAQRLLAATAIVAFAALTWLHAGETPTWTAFDDIGQALAALAATVACAVRVKRELRARDATSDGSRAWRAWLLLAAGAGCWTVGQIACCVYEVGFNLAPPPVSALDAAFLAFPLLVTAGLLTMVHTPARRLSQVRGAVEGLLIASGFFLLSWSLIVGSVVTSVQGASALAEAVNLAYPALDAVALAAVLFLALRRRGELPAGLGLLALGIVCVALSDSAFWYLNATASDFPGTTPLDTGWVAGFALIALAAFAPARERPRWTRLAGSRAMLVAPVMPVALASVAVLARWLIDGRLGAVGGLLEIATVVVGLALMLLVIVSYENDALTSDLERRVRARTAQLHATERYYRALVQHSSDVVMVVDRDLTIRYVSDSVLDIFGYRPDQLTDRDLTVFGKVAGKALGEALGRAAFLSGEIARVEWTLEDAAGRARQAESSITNLLLDPNVEAFVLNTRDETDRVALQSQLRHQAFHDPLTGLSNRALLSDRASQAFARSLRTGADVAVIVVDLDEFKLINDNLGHQLGDALLREVAKRLQAAARPEDTVARIGGDEFLVLVDAVGSLDEALSLAERLRGALEARFVLDGVEHAVTASIGVAVGRASSTSFDQLLCDADMAMYSVKAGGRDAVQQFQPSMHERARERFRLQADLGKALERDEFWLLYQPEFDATGEQLEGFEALIRWNHPTRGLVRPDLFIPYADDSGLIVPIGRWVLREALREAAGWDALSATAEPLSIAVNVSAVQLKAPSLLADVQDALEQSKIEPSRVVLEITEHSLVEDSQTVIGVLDGLKKLGVRLAIDDFGTGYASLSYLQRMPVDILKIDQSFVQASVADARGRELLEAIVAIGQSMSLETIAEGVEHAAQLELVQDMGCDLVQGFLLGRPLSLYEVRRLISSARVPSAMKLPAP
jgi:diguanylate cyclase (GGDEF)-like protein/PAS domain S-box-containing protein